MEENPVHVGIAGDPGTHWKGHLSLLGPQADTDLFFCDLFHLFIQFRRCLADCLYQVRMGPVAEGPGKAQDRHP